MVVRASIIMAAAWSLALLPALCDGGAIAHVCACETPACNYECGCGPDPCDQVVSSSEQIKPEFDSVAVASPVVLIPSGVDADGESPLIRAFLHLPVPHSLRCFDSALPLLN